jgi:hypothetical protein
MASTLKAIRMVSLLAAPTAWAIGSDRPATMS